MAGPYSIADVPGVPVLNFIPGAEQGIELLNADGIFPFSPAASQWGIYLNGSPVVQADSVADFSLKKEWALSDYPIEGGSFANYDKVILPFDVRIRFMAGGSLSNRAALLASVEAIAGSLALYDAVTPDSVYTSCNPVHFDYKRTSRNGVGLLIVDVWLFQVRVINSSGASGGADTGAATGDTQEPSGADATNGGTVQTTEPTDAQAQQGAVAASPYGDLSGANTSFGAPAEGASSSYFGLNGPITLTPNSVVNPDMNTFTGVAYR